MQLTRKRNGILASYEILHLYFHFKGYCFSNFETQRSLRSKLISLPAVGGGGGRVLVSNVDLNKVSRHIHLEARRKKRGNKGKNQAAMKSFITDTIYTYYTRSFKQI